MENNAYQMQMFFLGASFLFIAIVTFVILLNLWAIRYKLAPMFEDGYLGGAFRVNFMCANLLSMVIVATLGHLRCWGIL